MRQTLEKVTSKQASLPYSPIYSIAPYKGEWTYKQAAHLLRRTTFGVTYAQIKEIATKDLPSVVDALLDNSTPLPPPPINYNKNNDYTVPIGETWVNAPYGGGVNLTSYRLNSLYAWNMGVLLESTLNIREKMTLFWHNHFVVDSSIVKDAKVIYRYISTLRANATGNFKDLVKLMTIEPAMLRYLNGNTNNKNKPNENYARELLELFTIGKGDAAGPGDYTTFTEDDVIEVAKVLTGWRDRGFKTKDPDQEIYSEFLRGRHNRESKQLSHRFDNAVIENADDKEYEQLIDVIFQQPEVARFICRKLYRWFVYYKIDEAVEANIIQPLADTLIANDFEIAPVIRQLLLSEHFFDAELIGPMIKNPLDFVLPIFRQFEIAIPEDDKIAQYKVWNFISNQMPNLQMTYFKPPDVAGWKAYYQAPGFYKGWISSVTLTSRMLITDTVTMQNRKVSGIPMKIDVLAFVAKIDDALDPNAVLAEFAKILFTQPLTESQHAFLKEILIPGLPDYEWTVEYSDHLSRPNNNGLRRGVENRLKSVLQAMLSMPEYYLM